MFRINRSGRSGRGLALTPQRAKHAAAAPDYIATMAIGDCLDSDADSAQVTRVACDLSHDEQIAERVDIGDGYETYPGLAALQELADPVCRIAAAASFTGGTMPPGFEFAAHVPTESSWNSGAREAVCTVRQVSGKLTGPVRP
ncbi:Septum formation [Amycolatopsis pretoriensis]|uniref:Septum formation n=1 Tax=Amycolatopsis pretoriensis TaxID=218821 RepID=A0A1H5RG59_9PSEU|nr:septum formation family protein [Amycolatopsis pretoriensis]SEF37325.1 Septum formation [Amycolatopsis pretoriensis]